jgi:hypothetical protein
MKHVMSARRRIRTTAGRSLAASCSPGRTVRLLA